MLCLDASREYNLTLPPQSRFVKLIEFLTYDTLVRSPTVYEECPRVKCSPTVIERFSRHDRMFIIEHEYRTEATIGLYSRTRRFVFFLERPPPKRCRCTQCVVLLTSTKLWVVSTASHSVRRLRYFRYPPYPAFVFPQSGCVSFTQAAYSANRFCYLPSLLSVDTKFASVTDIDAS